MLCGKSRTSRSGFKMKLLLISFLLQRRRRWSTEEEGCVCQQENTALLPEKVVFPSEISPKANSSSGRLSQKKSTQSARRQLPATQEILIPSPPDFSPARIPSSESAREKEFERVWERKNWGRTKKKNSATSPSSREKERTFSSPSLSSLGSCSRCSCYAHVQHCSFASSPSSHQDAGLQAASAII